MFCWYRRRFVGIDVTNVTCNSERVPLPCKNTGEVFLLKEDIKQYACTIFSCKLFTTKTFIFQSYFNSNQNGTFLGYSRMGVECERPQLPKICGTNTAMMRIGTVIVYLKEVQKIYELRDALLYDRWHQRTIDSILIHHF